MLKGATRVVIPVGRVVIKLPRMYSWAAFLRGLLANLNGRLFWKEMKHPYLAKIYYADIFGLVLVMERAIDVLSDREVYKSALDFLTECERKGLPVDKHCSNIGVFKTGFKLIDYGG